MVDLSIAMLVITRGYFCWKQLDLVMQGVWQILCILLSRQARRSTGTRCQVLLHFFFFGGYIMQLVKLHWSIDDYRGLYCTVPNLLNTYMYIHIIVKYWIWSCCPWTGNLHQPSTRDFCFVAVTWRLSSIVLSVNAFRHSLNMYIGMSGMCWIFIPWSMFPAILTVWLEPLVLESQVDPLSGLSPIREAQKRTGWASDCRNSPKSSDFWSFGEKKGGETPHFQTHPYPEVVLFTWPTSYTTLFWFTTIIIISLSSGYFFNLHDEKSSCS